MIPPYISGLALGLAGIGVCLGLEALWVLIGEQWLNWKCRQGKHPACGDRYGYAGVCDLPLGHRYRYHKDSGYARPRYWERSDV